MYVERLRQKHPSFGGEDGFEFSGHKKHQFIFVSVGSSNNREKKYDGSPSRKGCIIQNVLARGAKTQYSDRPRSLPNKTKLPTKGAFPLL